MNGIIVAIPLIVPDANLSTTPAVYEMFSPAHEQRIRVDIFHYSISMQVFHAPCRACVLIRPGKYVYNFGWR